jgi:hypothetical protein
LMPRRGKTIIGGAYPKSSMAPGRPCTARLGCAGRLTVMVVRTLFDRMRARFIAAAVSVDLSNRDTAAVERGTPAMVRNASVPL